MMKFLMHRRFNTSHCTQTGSIVFTLFAAVALIGVLGAGAITVMKGPVSSMSKVTKRAVAENSLMVGGKLAVANAMAQGNGGDCDADGMVEPVEPVASGIGTPPVGGGFIPTTVGITREDPWGTTYGYCVWDHGSKRLSGDCPTNNRLSGQADSNGTLIAVISAGPDKVFQTSCGAAPTYVQRVSGSDDSLVAYSFSEIQAQMGGIWNLKSSDAAVAEISKTVEVKNAAGTVTSAISNTSGIGEFIGLIVGKIKGKLTAPVSMNAGLKIDNNTNVTTCVAGQAGTLRYHATNGVEVCNGTAFVATGTAASTGGYQYNGLFAGKLSLSFEYSCALRTDGAAYCWGMNTNGILGDGTTVSRSIPVAVSGGHKFVQIATSRGNSDFSTCGLRTDGAAYCWGSNTYGQIGNGTKISSPTPVAVSGGHKFVQIAVGGGYACGLRTDGTAYCWGNNVAGALGVSSPVESTFPIAVSGGRKFVQIDAGFFHACGLLNDGAAYCWGYNANGRLGDGTSGNKSVPTAVTGNYKFSQIRTGVNHTCGIRTDGAAYCWGYNDEGTNGDGTYTSSLVPVAVSGGHKFVDLATGGGHTCGIRTDGAGYCWGYNESGPLGTDNQVDSAVPVAVLGGSNFAKVATGGAHTCGIRANGAVFCWGFNNNGQLGDGSVTVRLTMRPVSGFSLVDYQNIPYKFGDDGVACGPAIAGTMRYHATNGIEICNGTSYGPVIAGIPPNHYRYNNLFEGKLAVFQNHTCALRWDGSAFCWGENWGGLVGDGTTTRRLMPTRVSGGHRFVQISGQHMHACGLKTNGTAWCWGSNDLGQLGDGTTVNKSVPTPVSGTHKFVQIIGGQKFTCGLRTDGATYCWGENATGKLGTGNTNNSSSPVVVSGLHKFVQIAVGHEHACGLKTDGTAWCWGMNSLGQVGDGTTSQKNAPVAVIGGQLFSSLVAGGHSTCGIRADGAAYCWGNNDNGQLGDGTLVNKSTPTLVLGGYTYASISPAYQKTCAVQAGGTSMCWGKNSNGEFGNETTTASSIPVVIHGGTGAEKLITGSSHTCGLRSNGMLLCWGDNAQGQLGNNSITSSLIPVPVIYLFMTEMQNKSYQFSNDALTCTTEKTGTMRYTGTASPWEYCNGTAWGAF